MSDVVELKGHVVFLDLEGGIWELVTEDSQRYCLLELPQHLQVEGQKLRLKVRPFVGFSIQMRSNMVEVIEGELLGEL